MPIEPPFARSGAKVEPENPGVTASGEGGPTLQNPSTKLIANLASGANCQGLFVPKAASPYIEDLTGTVGDGDWTTVPTDSRSFYDDGDLWTWGEGRAQASAVGHLQITGAMTLAILFAQRSATGIIGGLHTPGGAEVEADNILHMLWANATDAIWYESEYSASATNTTLQWTALNAKLDLGPRLIVSVRDASGNVTLYDQGVSQGQKVGTPPTGGTTNQLRCGAAGPWRMLLIDNAKADATRLAEIHAAFGLTVS